MTEHTQSSPREKEGRDEDAEVMLAVTLATIPIWEESEAGTLTPGKKKCLIFNDLNKGMILSCWERGRCCSSS